MKISQEPQTIARVLSLASRVSPDEPGPQAVLSQVAAAESFVRSQDELAYRDETRNHYGEGFLAAIQEVQVDSPPQLAPDESYSLHSSGYLLTELELNRNAASTAYFLTADYEVFADFRAGGGGMVLKSRDVEGGPVHYLEGCRDQLGWLFSDPETSR